jgi:hypothetical protein
MDTKFSNEMDTERFIEDLDALNELGQYNLMLLDNMYNAYNDNADQVV